MLRAGWLLLLALIVIVCGAVILSGLLPLRSGRIESAVARVAVANWSIAIASTAISTFAWPILVFAALLPSMVAVPTSPGDRCTDTWRARSPSSRWSPPWACCRTSPDSPTDASVDHRGGDDTFVPGMAALLLQLSLANPDPPAAGPRRRPGANLELRRSEEALAQATPGLGHRGPDRPPGPLVHAIYPPALTEHGMVMALGTVTVGRNQVHLVADGVGRHPPDVRRPSTSAAPRGSRTQPSTPARTRR